MAVIGGVLPRSASGMRLARVLNWAALGTQSSGADLPGCPSIAQRSCPARMHTCCRTGATERPQDRGPPFWGSDRGKAPAPALHKYSARVHGLTAYLRRPSTRSPPPCTGGGAAVPLKWPQFGADALSHARGVRWFLSWAPPYVRTPIRLPCGPPTHQRCTTRPWTRMRPGQVNARRYICRPGGCAPCDTATQGRASSSQPRRRLPRWLTQRVATAGNRRDRSVGLRAR